MTQGRLNSLMVLHYHQELADSQDMAVVANEFISACPSWKNEFAMRPQKISVDECNQFTIISSLIFMSPEFFGAPYLDLAAVQTIATALHTQHNS